MLSEYMDYLSATEIENECRLVKVSFEREHERHRRTPESAWLISAPTTPENGKEHRQQGAGVDNVNRVIKRADDRLGHGAPALRRFDLCRGQAGTRQHGAENRRCHRHSDGAAGARGGRPKQLTCARIRYLLIVVYLGNRQRV